MPNGYRLIVFAVGGIALFAALFFGAYFGSLYSPDNKQYQAVASDQSGKGDYQGPSQSLPDISGLPSPVERAIANPRPTTGVDHEKRDLAAQEASALWAFYVAVASFASVLITAVGTAFLYKQIVLTREAVEDTGKATLAMQRQNDIAEDTAKRQLRAYVSSEEEMIVGFYPQGPAIMRTKVFNRGQTPAYDLKIWSVVTGAENPHTVKIRHPGNEFAQSSAVLGPGQWVIHENDCQNPLSRESYYIVAGGGLSLIFAGIISYRDAFGRRRYTTFKHFFTGDGNVRGRDFDLTGCERGNNSN